MNISKAITLHLFNQPNPVVTSYELGKALFELYKKKRFQGETIKGIRKDRLESRDYTRIVRGLVDRGILSHNSSFSSNFVFNVLGRKSQNPEDIICSVDPFCYISHLSAMSYHGLTNRDPQILTISTPSLHDWTDFAKQKMAKDLTDSLDTYLANGLPRLVRIGCKKKIQGRSLSKYSGKHLGAFKTVKDRTIKVSTIGRTFIDMVREPKRCGGIRHVVDCYEEFGKEYSSLIISEADQHANLIEKARIGYLLEEIGSVKSEALDNWAQGVERGGSRKLDSSSEYSPVYSARWCISINL